MVRSSACALALFFTACGSTPPPATTQPSAPVAAPTPKLPAPGPAPQWAPPPVQTWTMDSGLEVWFLQQNQAPLVSLQLVFPEGAATDPVGKAGATALMLDMLDEGAGAHSALQLSEALQRLATDYGVSAATDGMLVSMNLLADKLDPSLALLKDILRAPKFDQTEFDRRKAQRQAGAIAQEADPGYARSLTTRRALFGAGYGGMPPGGTGATLKGLTLDDIKGRYRKVIQPSRAKLIVVGAVSRANFEAAWKTHFGDWRGTGKSGVRPVKAEKAVAAIHFIDFPGGTQSSISVAQRTAGMLAKDRFATQIFNRPLGGAFTSRINLNLREDKGYTYGSRSGFNRWRKSGFFSVSAKVKASTTRASIDEIFKEFDWVIGSKPISQEERDKAVEGLLLGFPGRFERMSSVGGQLASLALDGLPSDALTAWPAKVGAVTLGDARKAANTYAQKGDFIIVIAGDWALVGPTLAGLNLPIIHHDHQGNPIANPAVKP